MINEHSVRVSNELGAHHPRRAKFSVLVVVIAAFLIGLVFSTVILIFKNQYPSLFSNSPAVKDVVYQLTPLLAFCILVNNVQPALSGKLNTPPLYKSILNCFICLSIKNKFISIIRNNHFIITIQSSLN